MARKKPAPPSSSQADQRAALFAGVKETSDDDAPRLVLADWLEENGDEDDRAHAELIRVQCEILRITSSLIDPERPGPILNLFRWAGNRIGVLLSEFNTWLPTERLAVLYHREHQLAAHCNERLRSSLPGVQHYCRWHHGFAYLNLQSDRFRSRNLAAFAGSLGGPRVEFLALAVSPSSVGTIARNVLLAHAVGLAFDGVKASAAELTTLLASPHLARLRRLDVARFARKEEVAAIALAPQSSRLTHLYLSRLPYGLAQGDPEAMRILATADLPRLQALHLDGNRALGSSGAELLAAAPFLSHVQELILTGCNIGDAGLAALVSGPHFHCPSRLDVAGNNLGPASLRALLGAPGVENLTVLGANDNAFDDAAVAEMATSPRLAGLLALNLNRNQGIGPASAEALAASPHLRRLASLGLMGCPISEAGARALIESPHLPRLRLSISGYGVSKAAVTALRERYILHVARPSHMV
jgi:uncharacterized protein (TIGR02996 family)